MYRDICQNGNPALLKAQAITMPHVIYTIEANIQEGHGFFDLENIISEFLHCF